MSKGVLDLSKELDKTQPNESENVNTKYEPIKDHDSKKNDQNQNGLNELPIKLGKQKLAQLRRNFNLIQNSGLKGLNQKQSNEFDLSEEPRYSKNSQVNLDQNKDGEQAGGVQLDDFRLSNIGLSVDSSHGRRKETLDLIELHKLTIFTSPGKQPVIGTPKPRAVDQTEEISDEDGSTEENSQAEGRSQTEDGMQTKDNDPRAVDQTEEVSDVDGSTEENSQAEGRSQTEDGMQTKDNDQKYMNPGDNLDTVNKLDFVSNFFVREVLFNCTEGKYYKRGCNICFCTKGSQWKPCTKVKCAKNVEFFNNFKLSKPENGPLKKLRDKATGCIPGQKIKTEDHNGKCTCVCALPSVMQCPLCAAVDRIKINLDNDKRTRP